MGQNEEQSGNNDDEPTKPKSSNVSNEESKSDDKQQPRKPKYKFRGEVSEMHGHVYQTFKESNDKRQFVKTTEALGRYINKTSRYSNDLKCLYTQLKNPTIEQPDDLDDKDVKDPRKLLIWSEETKEYRKRLTELENNLRNIYSVIWGQCSLSLQSKIKEHEKFEEKDDNNDCAWLLNQIKNVLFKFDSKQDIFY